MMCSSISFSFWSRSSCSSMPLSPSISFVAQNRAGMPSRSAWSSIKWTTAWMARCTGEPASQKSVTLGRVLARATSCARSMSSATPSFFTALMGTTGMPRAALSFSTSTVPPLARSSSIMLRARTVGTCSSRSWRVRYRLRSIFVASTILMMASGFSWMIKSFVTISSCVYGRRE